VLFTLHLHTETQRDTGSIEDPLKTLTNHSARKANWLFFVCLFVFTCLLAPFLPCLLACLSPTTSNLDGPLSTLSTIPTAQLPQLEQEPTTNAKVHNRIAALPVTSIKSTNDQINTSTNLANKPQLSSNIWATHLIRHVGSTLLSV
jgi:hypothetical protein